MLTTARLAHIPRGALPSIPRWLWISALPRRRHRDVRRRQPGHRSGLSGTRHWAGCSTFLRITAVSIVSARARRDGVVDHQRRRNRPRRGHIGPAACGRCGYRSTTGRWRWRLALRAFPMLVDEFRVLYAARRLRPKTGTHHAAGAPPAVGAGGRRPARRGHHRRAAAGRRNGRCDHRPRRRRSNLGGAVAAETGRLGGAFDRGPGVWRRAGAGTHAAGHQLALGASGVPRRFAARCASASVAARRAGRGTSRRNTA